MVRSALALPAVALAALVLAGCTRVAAPEAGGRHPWTQPHVLRLADVADPDSLNPFLSTMDLSYDLSSLMFSYLIIANRAGLMTGDLATEVPSLANGGISNAGRTYTYHLRRGVVWHDGVPLTARDVVFSWRAIMSPHNSVLHREGYEEVTSIDARGDDTVVVHLRRRYPPFLSQFFTTLQEGAKPIVPEHLLGGLPSIGQAAFNAHPIGSGPFRFVRWDRGSRIVLERNDRYFKGRPKLDRVELTIVPDENTVMTELQTHAVDMPVGSSALVWNRFRHVPGFRTRLDPWNSLTLLALDDSRPILRDVKVRRAIAAAIDYRTLIHKLTYDSAQMATNAVPSIMMGSSETMAYAYDPVHARAALDAAGWHARPDGMRVKNGAPLELLMVIPSTGSGQRYALQLQRMLHDVGISVTIKMYPYRGVFAYDGPIVTGRYDLAAYADTLPYDPDRTNELTCNMFSPKGMNEFRFCDPALDALEREGIETDDLLQRAAIYRQATALIHQDVPFVPLLQQRRPAVMNDDLRGYDPSPVAAPWWNAWTWDI